MPSSSRPDLTGNGLIVARANERSRRRSNTRLFGLFGLGNKDDESKVLPSKKNK